jgi:hypothetical protein
MALTGHSASQAPQLMQASEILKAIVSTSHVIAIYAFYNSIGHFFGESNSTSVRFMFWQSILTFASRLHIMV